MKQLLDILKGSFEWLKAQGVSVAASAAIVLSVAVVYLSVKAEANNREVKLIAQEVKQSSKEMSEAAGKIEYVYQRSLAYETEQSELKDKVSGIARDVAGIRSEQSKQGGQIAIIADRMPDPLSIYREFNKLQTWQDSTGNIIDYLVRQDAKNRKYNISVTPL